MRRSTPFYAAFYRATCLCTAHSLQPRSETVHCGFLPFPSVPIFDYMGREGLGPVSTLGSDLFPLLLLFCLGLLDTFQGPLLRT
ncbi:hypothetical protein VTI28DRAFT_4086 [Corynascus sepedonium]